MSSLSIGRRRRGRRLAQGSGRGAVPAALGFWILTISCGKFKSPCTLQCSAQWSSSDPSLCRLPLPVRHAASPSLSHFSLQASLAYTHAHGNGPPSASGRSSPAAPSSASASGFTWPLSLCSQCACVAQLRCWLG